MKIREMKPADKRSLQKNYLECRKKTFDWLDPASFGLADFDKDTEGEWLLVAEDDSRVVGFSPVWVEDNFLHHLFVNPAFQSQGIGKTLLKACLDQKLKRPARLKCVVRNRMACNFYEKTGWVVESTSATGPMGPYHNYLLK